MKLPDYLITPSYRGLLYDWPEEYRDIIEGLTQYLEEHPCHGTVYNNRGMAYAEIGEYDKALEDC